jgi:hypothetical protein
MAVAACTVVFGIMLGLVAFQAKIAADQARLDRIDKDTAAAQADYARLRLQVVQLEAPQNVIDAAKKSGMVTPTTVDYVTPSVADVVAADTAAGRGTGQNDSAPTPSADDWAKLKPIVGGAP